MLARPLYPRQKNVMVINDYPNKNEIDRGESWSSYSNLSLLTALSTGRVHSKDKSLALSGFKGIKGSDMYTTYLDFGNGSENTFDYIDDFRKHKELVLLNDKLYPAEYTLDHVDVYPDNYFVPNPLQKDSYVHQRLWQNVLDLMEEIQLVQPKIIIVTGKWGLYFLTGVTTLAQNLPTPKDKKPLGGLLKWRASSLQLHALFNLPEIIVFPMYHTLNSVMMPDKIRVIELDLQKVAWMYQRVVVNDEGTSIYLKPDKRYHYSFSFEDNISYLNQLKELLDSKPYLVGVDIETMHNSVIDCIGFTLNIDEGFCVPFCTAKEVNLWSEDEEAELLFMMQEILTHPNMRIMGQNFSYDSQYLFHFWLIVCKATHDTMILHHVLFNYMSKNLSFLASLYCDSYKYWKDEVEVIADTPETRWIYNVKDVCYTLEIVEVLLGMLEVEPTKLQEFYAFQIDEVVPALTKMMNKGIRTDINKKQQLYNQLNVLLEKVEAMVNDLLGFEINLKSFPQVKALFKDFLGIKPVFDKKTKSETFGSVAMLTYLEQYPIHEPLIKLILEYRTMGIFVRTFLKAEVDFDNRLRCSYNAAGTKSYRLSSKKNAFGRGLNLANVPSKGKIDLKFCLTDYDFDSTETEDEDDFNPVADGVYEGISVLPNCKELFLPDPGYTFFNIDYSGADAMVVAADADCAWLLNFFKTSTEKLYVYVASHFYQRQISTKDKEYKVFKQYIHGTHYGMMEEKAASNAGISLKDAKTIREWYFKLCPEIPEWHKRIKNEVYTRGYIENIFGARFWLLDRNSPTLLNQAYALIPQSTIAILVNKGLVAVDKHEANVDVLMQIHDAIAGQFISTDLTAPNRIQQHMEIALPYKEPLIIPADITTSTISYGHC